jgi:hypothetical protein
MSIKYIHFFPQLFRGRVTRGSRDGNRACSTRIYSSQIHTRETKTQLIPVPINVRGYGYVSILVHVGYPLSSRYPLTAPPL